MDEADYLTPQAQAALRRIMEFYYKSVRFILTANTLSKLIDAIRSRCDILHFRALHPSNMELLLLKISIKEGHKVPSDVFHAITEIVHGDARLALNILEGLFSLDNPTKEDVYSIIGTPTDDNVFKLIFHAVRGQIEALDEANRLVTDGGVNAAELLNSMYWLTLKGAVQGLTDEERLRVLEAIGMIPGASDEMRLSGILAKIIFASKESK